MKLMTLEEALAFRHQLKTQNKPLVFTNGCFDLLHPGHLRYLAQAKPLGHALLVGLNSDSSTKALKGPKRPICPEEVRAEMLAGLTSVDAVVIFSEETPLNLICALKPDVLVKGGDWKEEQIVGAQEVKENGGIVKSLLMADGFSTTALVDHIKGL
ncbi:MAG: D-glycero-beta-D-manno-heptose 1-phosphate adenylyltransferase [Candidatus Adiutrix sp.]